MRGRNQQIPAREQENGRYQEERDAAYTASGTKRSVRGTGEQKPLQNEDIEIKRRNVNGAYHNDMLCFFGKIGY